MEGESTVLIIASFAVPTLVNLLGLAVHWGATKAQIAQLRADSTKHNGVADELHNRVNQRQTITECNRLHTEYREEFRVIGEKVDGLTKETSHLSGQLEITLPLLRSAHQSPP